MACCAALAIMLAAVRTAWGWILGRDPAEERFPPAARWGSGRDAREPVGEPSVAVAAMPIGRALAATVLAYGLLVHLLAATGLAQVAAASIAGWAGRDAVLAVVMVSLLVLGRRRTATAMALVGVGALWFALGVIDMHVFGGFEFRAVPLVLDAGFHLSGWWLMVAAVGIAAVQHRSDFVPVGGAA